MTRWVRMTAFWTLMVLTVVTLGTFPAYLFGVWFVLGQSPAIPLWPYLWPCLIIGPIMIASWWAQIAWMRRTACGIGGPPTSN